MKNLDYWKYKSVNPNSEKGIQVKQYDYEKLLDTIINLTRKTQPGIAKTYGKKLTREYIKGFSMIGRYFDDGDCHELYSLWTLNASICPKCLKLYGQPYYAIECCKELKK